jgi:type IV secretion system protein TrbL
MTQMGEAMMGSWDSMMKEFLTSWLNVGLLVDLEAGSIQWLTAQLQVISVFLAAIGIMIAALWTMVHYRGEKAIKVAQAMFKVVLVTTVGAAAVQVIIAGGDAFSAWILDSAGITTDVRQIPLAIAGSSPGIAILGGIFGIIATIIQWGIMLVRSALLPLLVGVWPAAAAASMIGGADQAFSKITNWIIAFALYKPVAAIIYAYAWKTKNGDEGIGGVINGLVLIALAVIALPAMMRLLAPGTSALGGASGGGMALAGGAALVGAGVAAGAAVLSGGGSAAAGGTAKMAGGAGAAGSSGMATAGGSSGIVGGAGTADPGGGAGPSGGSTGGGGTGGSGSSGGGGAADGSSGAASETVGGDTDGGESAAGGTDAETMGTDVGAQEGGTGAASGTVGGDTAGEPIAAAPLDGGDSSPGADTSAAGTSEPTNSETSSAGAGSAAGASSPSGAPDTATPAAGSTENTSSKAKQAGTAASQSMSQAVADGAKEADGKDVIGE